MHLAQVLMLVVVAMGLAVLVLHAKIVQAFPANPGSPNEALSQAGHPEQVKSAGLAAASTPKVPLRYSSTTVAPAGLKSHASAAPAAQAAAKGNGGDWALWQLWQ